MTGDWDFSGIVIPSAALEMTMRHAKCYQNSAALLLFMRRTTIPNSSFLIPHSRKAFIHNQWTDPPKELTLKPRGLLRVHAVLHVYHSPLPCHHGIRPRHECLDLLFF